MEKFDYLQSYINSFKNKLNIDKKYLLVSKELDVLLGKITPFIKNIEASIESLSKQHHSDSFKINKDYAKKAEDCSKSLDAFIKNTQVEIEKNRKVKLDKLQDINQNMKFEFEKTQTKIKQEEQIAKNDTNDYTIKFKRESNEIKKLIDIAINNYKKTVLEIEIEKENALFAITDEYEKNSALIVQEESENDDRYNKELAEIEVARLHSSSEDDETYLAIKNKYTHSSIELNKMITSLKKQHQKDLTEIEKNYKALVKPKLEAIEHLNKEYETTQKNALSTYTDRLRSLNVIFDIQKEAYDLKKAKINFESNESITLYNSKLSAYRESTQEDKLEASRQIRSKIKSTDDQLIKDKLSRELTQLHNHFNSELNKQIIRTNKAILQKQREQQNRQLNHDQNQLKEINNWRFKKSVCQFQKKQDFAKSELCFHNDLTLFEQTLKLMEDHDEYLKEITLINHKKDLLPLQFQLSISASIQEKELNLLSSDAHLSIAEHNYKTKLLSFKLKLKKAFLKLQKKKLDALYQADKQVLNVSIQLELEKEKTKRDSTFREQKFRSDLNQLLLDKATSLSNYNLTKALATIESDQKISLIESNHLLQRVKSEFLEQERICNLAVTKKRYDIQLKITKEKEKLYLKMHKLELELNQQQTTNLADVAIMFHQVHHEARNVIFTLYHLPSHPEVLKDILSSLIPLIKDLATSANKVISGLTENHHAYYLKKVKDSFGYKHIIKHGNTINHLVYEISDINKKKDEVEQGIVVLENAFFTQQAELERNQLLIKQLENKTSVISSVKLQLSQKHSSLKADQKLVKHHEQEIARLAKDRFRIEKEIDSKHAMLVPLERQIDKLKIKQKNIKDSLDKECHKESASIHSFLAANEAVSKRLIKSLDESSITLNSFFKTLLDEVYLTGSFLDLELNKLDKHIASYGKQITGYHERFLNSILGYYNQNKKEQLQITNSLNYTTQKRLTTLKQSSTKALNSFALACKQQLRIRDKMIFLQENKLHKNNELKKLEYQKQLSDDSAKLKKLEESLTQNSTNKANELKIINENQLAIAIQYDKEFKQKTDSFQEVYHKLVQAINNSILVEKRNKSGFTESIQAKNQALLSKHKVAHRRFADSLKQKTLNYQQLIEKNSQVDANQYKQHKVILTRLEHKKTSDLLNIKQHHKKYLKNTKVEQNRIFAKEMRELRKSYSFKIKMLHLK